MRTLRRAFSLVELLAVVAIVLLLLALLFPFYNEARERARQAACLNNLHVQGAGLMSYAADHDGCITRWRSVDELAAAGRCTAAGTTTAGSNGRSPGPFRDAVLLCDRTSLRCSAGLYNQGYVKEPRSFYCPGDRVRRVTAAEDGAHYGQHGALPEFGLDPKDLDEPFLQPGAVLPDGRRQNDARAAGTAGPCTPSRTAGTTPSC
ncbi:MAG: prepilin-type N-terminal cleavage/methylation domain-containing protein [Kiritimatiellia bacterium]